MSLNKRISKKKMRMEDHGSLLYRNSKAKQVYFDEIEYEVSSVLLQLSKPFVLPSKSPCVPKWGLTKKRSSSPFIQLPEISLKPVIKLLPSTEVVEMGSTSSSSCLTGEAKKTNPQTMIKDSIEEEFSTKNQCLKPKISSSSCSVFETEMGLLRAQVGLVAQQQPIAVHQQYLRNHLQCVDRMVNNVGFDLNLSAAAMVDLQRARAAQARQRRLGIIRSKKLLKRFTNSPYQQYK